MITGSVLLSSKIIKFSKNHRWLLPYFLATLKNNNDCVESQILLTLQFISLSLNKYEKCRGGDELSYA
jgi:hypothetical protein